MKVFSTRPCEHLLKNMNIDHGQVTQKTFSDSEIYIRIEDDVANKHVCLVASTPAPAEHMLELFFMLDAFSRARAKVHLLITYFGYARQDRAEYGEALSAEVVFACLRQFPLEQTLIAHIHNQYLKRFFDFQDIILLDFFLPIIEKVDCIVAPDEGAKALALALGDTVGKPVVVMKKVRDKAEHVAASTFDGDVRNKHIVIVDDMIATGGTIISAAQVLKHHGAGTIYGAATHGIFSHSAYQMIQESPLDKLYVTNSLAQFPKSSRIEVIDCAPMLESIILSFS